MSTSSIPQEVRDAIARRDEGRCRYRHLAQAGQGATFHTDHVRPRSRGGPTSPDNPVLQCPWCSPHKSDKVTAVDPLDGSWSPLFHPLRHVWSDHLSMDDSGECYGRTAVGRSTVDALQMNDPLPRLARAMRVGHGLLPPWER